MPRYKLKKTTLERKKESSTKRYARNYKGFIDYYTEIFGTKPEKMVYAKLLIAQIPFEFQSTLKVAIPEIDLFKDYRPDFILPSAKIIIEVQGSYWHSKSEAIESDSYKYALFTAMGYKVLIWWDYEIETNLDALFDRDLKNWTFARGGRIIDPDRQVIRDDLKGLRTLNSKYKRKPYRTFIGAGKKQVRKAKRSYATR
jgi:G:T-mismatch repair DNA endonuclease (very short patch repair protein)